MNKETILESYEEKDIIRIYEEILAGDRKSFPIGFWDDRGEVKANILVNYLFKEKLKMDLSEALEVIDIAFLTKYKLSTVYKKIYGYKYLTIIKVVYPEAQHLTKIPTKKRTIRNLSKGNKNMPLEHRENIINGMRNNRYNKEYAKKLSDTKLGEINPAHKLNAEQVLEIRKLWATGTYSTTALGDRFGVKRQTVADIVYGRSWKHLQVE